jgi:hypothetical protein
MRHFAISKTMVHNIPAVLPKLLTGSVNSMVDARK